MSYVDVTDRLPALFIFATMKTTAIPASWLDIHEVARRSLATSLRRDGVELHLAAPDPMAPGTPVYVEVPVNISKVRRSMSKAHCQVVLVLQEDLVVGLIDLSEPSGNALLHPFPVSGDSLPLEGAT